MNELENKDLLEKIKADSDAVDIPEGIKPENMMKHIEEMKKQGCFEERKTSDKGKNNRRRKVSIITGAVTTVAVAAATGIVLLTTGAYRNIPDGGSDFENTKHAEIIRGDEDKNSGFRTLSGYKELNEYIVDYNENDRYYSNVDFDIAESAEGAGELPTDAAIESGSNSNKEELNDYSDTNVRTENVAEGDVVKTDGEYIYYLSAKRRTEDDYYLKIVKADGSESEMVCQYNINNDIDMAVYQCEMLVYKDTLVIVASRNVDEFGGATALFYDISDRSNIKLKDSLTVQGNFDSCRLTDGYLYIFTEKYIDYRAVGENLRDEEEAKKLLAPKVCGVELEPEDIYVTGCENYDVYHVITTVDMDDTSKFCYSKAILGDSSGNIYMSGKNIYYTSQLYNDFYDLLEKGNVVDGQEITVVNQSEILCMNYEKGIVTPAGRAVIDGSVGDEFDIDEYNGYLRMAVSVRKEVYKMSYGEYREDYWWNLDDKWYVSDWRSEQYSALYVFDENLNMTGSIPCLMEDESVYGVRFDGDIAYVVTYRQTDPLFTVDLSDPSNPVVIGKLKIPGFSTYLHKWDDNTLIGLGYDENGYVKVSTFDISDKTDVTERDICVLEDMYWSEALYNHKAVFVAPKKNLIGFMGYMEDGMKYKIFSYIDGELKEVINQNINDNEWGNIRGLYIGEYIYIVTENSGVYVYDMNTFDKVVTVR